MASITGTKDRIDPGCQVDFPTEEFLARRETIFGAIGGEAHALLQSAPAPREYVVFRQTNELSYSCGLEKPQAYLPVNGAERKRTPYLREGGEAQRAEGAPPVPRTSL